MTLVAEPVVTVGYRRIESNAPARQAFERDLSRRLRSEELRLLGTLATGIPLVAVADRLGMSERTIRRHIRNLCDEIGVRTPIEAVVWAARRRLI